MSDISATAIQPPSLCPGCGTTLAANLLACPACGRLVYADRLKQLAEEAAGAAHPAEALRAWRVAFRLLPEGSRQHAAVLKKIEELVPIAEATPLPPPANSESVPGQRAEAAAPRSWWARALAGLGVSAAFIAKFSSIAILILTKAKLLLLGLTKMSTLLSMAISFGLYWSLWGWKFALGFVLSIYVHEMGHVVMLNRLGIRATAPMYIPLFGAVIWHEKLPTAREDARVGLAGPMWGLGAAVAAFALSLAFHSRMMMAIASFGAVMNLFNLTPVWQLDGSWGFSALTRNQRWIVVGVVGIALLLSQEEVLVLVLIFAVFRAFGKDAASEPDNRALGEFIFLVVALTALVWMGNDGSELLRIPSLGIGNTPNS